MKKKAYYHFNEMLINKNIYNKKTLHTIDTKKNYDKKMVTPSLKEQTLTNITQGVRNHLTWENESAHTPARLAETSPI
jgi:hypothetical protein